MGIWGLIEGRWQMLLVAAKQAFGAGADFVMLGPRNLVLACSPRVPCLTFKALGFRSSS